MLLIRGLHNLTTKADGCVATIGNFDGVHLGHQAIIRQVRDKADALGVPAVVMVFEPQPREFFDRERAPARLTRFREKYELLKALGVDQVFCLQFNRRLRSTTADQFVDQVLVQGLRVRHLVVGDDFRFGCDRRGDYSLLAAAGRQHGFGVENTVTIKVDGHRVSSTLVREVLAEAELETAATLLGRPYTLSGTVIHGRQLGRQLGFPTANVSLGRKRPPLRGVFVVQVTAADGEQWPGVANIGMRPTVDGRVPALEVHVLVPVPDLYGSKLSVNFLKRMREEQQFASVADLQKQITEDVRQARIFHGLPV